MKVMRKRILSLVLALLMVFSLLSGVTQPAMAAVSNNYTLTGNQAKDIVAVATAQKGKTGSDFGWNVEWCAYFTCWAGRTAKADFPKTNIGNACDLAIWFLDNNKGSFYYFRDGNYTSLVNNGLKNTSAPIKASRSSFIPQKGDLICYLWTEDAGVYNWSHIGIVAETYSGSGNIKTIEGNTSGGVVASKSRAYDSTVIGFIRPNYKDTSNPNVAPKLTISGVSAPSKLALGESFPLRGVIKTNYGTITSVTASVTNASNKTVLTYTAKPKTITYDINGPMDDAITFGKLAEGTYTYTVKATAVNGSKSTTSTLVNQNFVVGTPKYTVSYNANGGTGAPAKQTKVYGKDLTLSSTKPTKSFVLTIDMNNPDMNYKVEKKTYNCTFSGWNTKANGTGTNYAAGAKYTSNAAVTLYAKWKNPTATYSAPEQCTCFLGLYTAPEGGQKMESGFTLTSNLTLYGHWNKTASATHNWGAWTVISAATCEKDGLKARTCKACGYTVEEKIPAASHSWDSGKVTKPATETATGIKTYTCTNCGATRNETLPKLVHTHNYTSTLIAPTCTTKGYTLHTCSCGVSFKDSYVDALGHKTQIVGTKAASCTEAGYSGDKVCTVCNVTIEKGSAIAAIGHKAELRNVKNATCTVAGYTGDKVCTVCNVTVEKGSTIAALGHSYKEGICSTCGANDPNHEPTAYPFTDVDVNGRHKPFAEAILWAANNNVTTGYGNGIFKPDADCTRAQVVTFLWRAAGSPEPESTDNPFTDVKNEGGMKPYYKAILWAVEEGITAGTSKTQFSPNSTCTRGQFVTFLWRYEGKPMSSGINPFTDVYQGSYYQAILWAYENGITMGYPGGVFRPSLACSRAQVVTFIYRYMAQ